MTRRDLIKELRRWGVRLTAQRLVVAEVIANSDDHPTAQDIYDRVRSRFPHITLGTIYNTLHVLVKTGFVQPLVFADRTRYDSNLRPHVNLICLHCGVMADALNGDQTVDALLQKVTTEDFEVVSQRVDFYGVCAACRALGPAARRPDRKRPESAHTGG